MVKCSMTKLFVICVIFVFILTFAGCVPTQDTDTPEPEGPFENEDIDEEETLCREAIELYFDNFIKDTRSDATIDDVKVDKCFGVYGDCLVIALYDYKAYYLDVLVEETVNGLTFVYPSGYDIRVYLDGEFFPLKEACERGFLTDTDLHTIYNLCNQT